MIIRTYEPRDRPAVRRIACDTAERGEPVRIFSDREVFADASTRYYTDFEPQSLWVAEHEGQVVGYLSGCLDDRRYVRVIAWRVIPAAVLRAIARGALWRQETWRLFAALLRTWRAGGLAHPSPREFPAHFHVNIQKGFRGQQIGQRLVERFFKQLRTAGVSGVHAGVRENNSPARRFFERLGFTALGREPVVLPEGGSYQTLYTITYGKRL